MRSCSSTSSSFKLSDCSSRVSLSTGAQHRGEKKGKISGLKFEKAYSHSISNLVPRVSLLPVPWNEVAQSHTRGLICSSRAKNGAIFSEFIEIYGFLTGIFCFFFLFLFCRGA